MTTHNRLLRGLALAILTDLPASALVYGPDKSGYGELPGSGGVNTSLQTQWRGHYEDWDSVLLTGSIGSTSDESEFPGFYYMGARYYDPASARFLSADPLGHASSMSWYDYCNGDPVNGFDPDGRFGKGAIDGMEGNISSGDPNSGAFNFGFDVGNGLSSLSTGLNTWGDEMTGVAEYQGLKSSYNSNYAYFGDSYDATVATLDPAYSAEAGFYELGSGQGIQAGDSGESLSGWQRAGSGFEGVAGTVGTVGLGFGGAGVLSASGLTAPLDNYAAQSYLQLTKGAQWESYYNSFTPGTAQLNITFGGQTLFRAANSEGAAAFGEFASVEQPATPLEAIQGAALDPAITSNTANQLFQVTTRPGFSISGTAAAQGPGYPGGFTQVFQTKLSGAPTWSSVQPIPYSGVTPP